MGATQDLATSAATATETREWWKDAVVYQIYPKSFNDSNGDGIGDLPGITAKLDYLDVLGVDVVWLSPIYASPQADNGYDISDYRSIDPQYGTMEDWRELRDGLHDRGMKLVMDLVVNHTSDEHDWFQASRDPTHPQFDRFKDFYIWREDPPNDWESVFGGPAWEYDEQRGAYYLHLFDTKQPDLNWRNPAVRDAIFAMMDWWLDNGIDGFRMDVINMISKQFVHGEHAAPQFMNGPRIHDYLDEMHDRVLSNHDGIMTVGETPDATVDDARQYTADRGALDMVFQFEHMHQDRHDGWWDGSRLDLPAFKQTIARWQTGLQEADGWEGVYLNNHDQPRAVSRFGNEKHRRPAAKLLGTLTHTLRGTPFIYQGEEIGMTNYPFDDGSAFRDVETHNKIREIAEDVRDEHPQIDRALADDDNIYPALPDRLQNSIGTWSRDNARTPMQWTDGENAGFTDADQPWIPINPNHTAVNAATARRNDNSVFSHYQDLIQLRDDHDVLVDGDFTVLDPDHEQVFAYTRGTGDNRALVVLNMTDNERLFYAPPVDDTDDADLLLHNYRHDPADTAEEQYLRPFEARIYML